MKLWTSYGAEHSLNLVIIGDFKEVVDAEEFGSLVYSLTKTLMNDKEFVL